mmetsp:Transcript_17967/g.22053  ORF Transcript_17967/g.22053 Transcript_17967/m.22053 type:complete len:214 (+) Transcript_17967:43-684(+)
MSLYTLIGRVNDGLLLCGTQSDSNELPNLKRHAKRIIKNIKSKQDRVSINADNQYRFHYYISYDICYIVLAHKSYPTGLAFCYLEDIEDKFFKTYGDKVYGWDTAYQGIKFANEMEQIRLDYLNPRNGKNLKRTNQKLQEIKHIMQSNLNDIISRGQSLDSIQDMSAQLKEGSNKFKKRSKWVTLRQQMEQYIIPIAIVIIIILVIVLRHYLM